MVTRLHSDGYTLEVGGRTARVRYPAAARLHPMLDTARRRNPNGKAFADIIPILIAGHTNVVTPHARAALHKALDRALDEAASFQALKQRTAAKRT